MYPRTPWDIVGEAWRRHCNLVQVEGVKLPIGDYIWVQGHAAAADGHWLSNHSWQVLPLEGDEQIAAYYTYLIYYISYIIHYRIDVLYNIYIYIYIYIYYII